MLNGWTPEHRRRIAERAAKKHHWFRARTWSEMNPGMKVLLVFMLLAGGAIGAVLIGLDEREKQRKRQEESTPLPSGRSSAGGSARTSARGISGPATTPAEPPAARGRPTS